MLGKFAGRRSGSDGYRRRSDLGIACIGIEHGAAFGADSGRKGGVLLIAAADHYAVLQQDGCPYLEVRLW